MEDEKDSPPPTLFLRPNCPWLVYSSSSTQTFVTIDEGQPQIRNIKEMQDGCWGCCHGWLVMLGRRNKCYLFNPISLQKIHLPPLKRYPNLFSQNTCSILSSPPTNPNCMVLFVDNRDRFFLFCRPTNNQWTKKRFSLARNESIICLVSCREKVYAMTLQGVLGLVEEVPNGVRLRLFEAEKPPYPPSTIRSLTYMVESCGELFLVNIAYLGFTPKISGLHIFKMDFSAMEWVEEESLGDRIFCLGGCSSVSCPAAEFGGGRGDCIYFTAEDDPKLYVFDVDDGSLRRYLPCRNLDDNWSRIAWIMPVI